MMSRALRQRLALFLGFVMLTFSVCQSMALAYVPDSMRSDSASMAEVSCHEAPPQGTSTAQDCPSDCNAVVKVADAGPQFLSLLPLIFIAFQFPDLVQETGSIHLASLGQHAPVTDPPPDIRYHRFRE